MQVNRDHAESADAFTAYACALGVGLIAFFVLSLGRVNGVATYWDIPLGDAAQALNAIELFAYEAAWRWPLLSFEHPGRNTVETIILADGIPLYALIVKTLADLGLTPPLLFTWRVVTLVGQPVAMVWLLRTLGVGRLSLLVLGAGLAVLLPAFLERGHANHLALSAHAIAIAGAAAGIGLRTERWPRAAAGWTGLLAVSLLVHPYFFAMNAALFAGWLIDRGLADRALGPAGSTLVCVTAGVGFVLWAGGYGPAAAMAGNSGGFGHFSMNLLSPVAVTQGWFVPGATILDATGGQSEGYSYLGLGVLVLLAAAAWTGRSRIRPAMRRCPGVIMTALGLSVFALSSQVYIGHWLLADLSWLFEHVPLLPETFRSSGRLFWPVCYLLVGLALAGIQPVWPAATGRAAMVAVAVLALQAADVQTVARRWFETPVSGFNEPGWANLIKAHERLSVYPPGGCTETHDARFINPEYAYAAQRYGLSTNSFSAEAVRRDCPETVPALETGRLAPATLYVFHGSVADYAAIQQGPGVDACRQFRRSFLCSARPDVFHRADFLKPVASPVAGLDLVFGKRYPLRAGSPGRAVLARGWYGPEAWGTWSRAGTVSLLLPGDLSDRALEKRATHVRLILRARMFIAGSLKKRRVGVSLDGQPITTWTFTRDDPVRVVTADIPVDRNAGEAAGPIRVTLTISGDVSPAEAGTGGDPRSLGLGAEWLSVEPASPPRSRSAG